MKISTLTTYVIVGSVAGYPLVASINSAFGISSNIPSQVFRSSILFLSLMSIGCFTSRGSTAGFAKMSLLFVLFFYGLRLAYETVFKADLLGQSASYYWIFFLGTTFFPSLSILITEKIDTERSLRILKGMLTVAVILTASLSLATIVSGIEQISIGRAGLEKLNPISVGNLGATVILIFAWSMFRSKSLGIKTRLWLLAGILLGIFTLFISASKGPIVGLFAALLFFILSQNLRQRVRVLFFIFLIGVPVTFYFVALADSLNVSTVQRILNVRSGVDASTLIRLDMYSLGIASVLENPLFGAGIEVPKYRFYPHNFFIEMFMATGVYGGILSILLFSFITYSSFKLLSNNHHAGWISLLFIFNLSGAMFSGSVYGNSALWVTAALVISVRSQYMRQLTTAYLPQST